ncbi:MULTISPECIES: GNAT family N-acetyltransferase [unclassified Streptomyces]|uniref:GNAT family N-acetyltransferase n=1 Tax=unclassified Streptomyces TaxID=2593676 RepID=UPI003814E453
MTTTLRPTEPLQRADGGALSRAFQVCVNSRPVGTVHLSTHPEFGPAVARVDDLRIEEPDRGRGRGAVAALAAEEVARGWGCRRVEIRVPAQAEGALRLATALGYVHRNRGLEKQLGPVAPALPDGSRARPMTEAEFGPWWAANLVDYARQWTLRGVPAEEARAKAERDSDLPEGLATPHLRFLVLEHENTPVGTLWGAFTDTKAFVYGVEVDEAFRGHGHGRTLMLLAEREARAAGQETLGLNVFADNTPAERLYASLGYVPVGYSMYKSLL